MTFTFERLTIEAADAGTVYCWDAETDADWVETTDQLAARAERVRALPYPGSAQRADVMAAAAAYFARLAA